MLRYVTYRNFDAPLFTDPTGKLGAQNLNLHMSTLKHRNSCTGFPNTQI